MVKLNNLYILYLFLVTFFLAEITLRSFGYQPGFFRKYKDFQIVDSLVEYKNFTTDEYGILKFSSWVTDTIPAYFDHTSGTLKENKTTEQLLLGDDLKEIFRDYAKLAQIKQTKSPNELLKDNWDTPFAKMILSVSPSASDLDAKENLLLKYLDKPFNKEGFRSIPFKQASGSEPKVMLVGDSYVYGMGADPYFNSFYDLLLSKNYVVYNAGIPGVDPAQYAAVVKKYVPKLTPEFLVLNFFAGNDYMYYNRHSKQGEPFEHSTNAGFISCCPQGKFLDAKQAYDYYIGLISIPDQDIKVFNRICAKSALLSILWGGLQSIGWVEHPTLIEYNGFRFDKTDREKVTITAIYIDQIANVCRENGTQLIISVIPDNWFNNKKNGKHYWVYEPNLKALFNGKEYHIPSTIAADDVPDHFNNEGHIKYANFLDSLIKSQL